MKINLYAVSLFFAINIASGQNIGEQKKILSTYDLSRAKDLLLNLKARENEREAKVTDYVLKNNISKRFLSFNEKKYQIVDIIDGKPIYISTDNALSAKAIKTNKLHPNGGMGFSLEGEGMNIGVWDGGWIRGTHTEFNTSSTSTVSRVSYPDTGSPNPTSDSHGTHVGGTIGARGANTSAKGMAPKSNIRSFNWDNDRIEVFNEITLNALLISNHSYGTPIYNDSNVMVVPNWYMGCYSDAAVEWDLIGYDFPYYLMVASAGNSGNEMYTGGIAPGYDKLTGNKNSKNNLVIANANPSVHPITGNLVSLVINPGSSQGPTDDGRIKPDIAADGTGLYSSFNTNDTSYESLSGTSMASPSVAGTLLLLQEHYNNLNNQYLKSATLKGLVCHTAFDDAATIGPDPKFGWGLLDAQASAQAITSDSNSDNKALIRELELNATTTTYTMNFSAIDPTNLKATICWTDPAGTQKNGSLNNTTPALVNDLDLRITQGATTYYPWKFDLNNLENGAIKGDNIVDNIERVDVTSGVSGQYTLTITHKGTLTNGSQPFSLILTGTGLSLSTSENSLGQFSIWPNPTTDRLHFDSKDKNVSAIKVYDITGKQMSVKVFNDYIDVSSLQQGVYVLKVATDSSTNAYKFIKK